MQAESELLPAAMKIVERAQDQLESICGKGVRLKIEFFEKNKVTYLETNEQVECVRLAVCDHFNVKWNDITSQSRLADLVFARHVYWYASIKFLGRGLKALGRECNRDHTAVISARDKIKGFLDVKEERTVKAIEVIRHALGLKSLEN